MSDINDIFEFVVKALGSLPERMNPHSYDLEFHNEDLTDKKRYYELRAELKRQTDGKVIAERAYRYGAVEKDAQHGDLIKQEEERIKYEFILELLLRGALKTEELVEEQDMQKYEKNCPRCNV